MPFGAMSMRPSLRLWRALVAFVFLSSLMGLVAFRSQWRPMAHTSDREAYTEAPASNSSLQAPDRDPLHPIPDGQIAWANWVYGWGGQKLHNPDDHACFIPPLPGNSTFPKRHYEKCETPIFSSLDPLTQRLTSHCQADPRTHRFIDGSQPKYCTQPPPKACGCALPEEKATLYTHPVHIGSEVSVIQCGQHINYHVQALKNHTRYDYVQYKNLNFSLNFPPSLARPSSTPSTPATTPTSNSTTPDRLPRPKVMVILLDTTSRFTFLQRMQHTVAKLESIASQTSRYQSKVYQFFRQNIVGVSTQFNVPQLMRGCRPFVVRVPSKVDSCSYAEDVRSQFHRQDYMVVNSQYSNQFKHFPRYIVDNEFCFQNSMGDITKYPIPSGECLRPDELETKEKDQPYYLKHSFMGTNVRSHCLGGKSQDSYAIDYIRQAFRIYKDVPLMSWLYLPSGHSPPMNGQLHNDANLAQLLEDVPLNETFVFMLGDHGLGYGEYAQTGFGQLEYRNPTFHVLAPTAYLTPESDAALQANTQRLTTVFDLHETLREIANQFVPFDENDSEASRNKYSWDFPGRSLLRPVPDRDCEAAGVPMQFCMCITWNELNTADAAVQALGPMIIDALRLRALPGILEGVCHELRWEHLEIKEALELPHWRQRSIHNLERINLGTYYRLTITAKHDHNAPANARRGLVLPRLSFFANIYVPKDSSKQMQLVELKRQSAYVDETCAESHPEIAEFCACTVGNVFS